MSNKSVKTNFRIHANFTESLDKLSTKDQKIVQKFLRILFNKQKITPGMRAHPVGPFQSLSPNMDLRVITSLTGSIYTLFYVDHHDKAYRWAKRTAILETGKKEATEIIDISNLDFLSNNDKKVNLPIPIQNILTIKNEDTFLNTIESLSPEWREWLLETYTSNNFNKNNAPTMSSLIYSPTSDEELQQALSLKLPDWRLFLHPIQYEAVEDKSENLITVSGGPGTGKTVVLLNRLLRHSPKKEKKGCSVFLTYSKGLADYLINLLRGIKDRYYYVFSLDLLNQVNGDQKSIPQRGGKEVKLKFDNESGLTIYHHRFKEIHVRELLVDEYQDVPIETIAILEDILNQGDTRIVMGGDSGQSIFRAKNQNTLNKFLSKRDSHYNLSYSYRVTQQIINQAENWSKQFKVGNTSPKLVGLSGPEVNFISCLDLGSQIKSCTNIIKDLRKRYSDEEIALIYCQYPNPSFSGKSREEDELKGHPQLSHFYKFASTTKGKEYIAGVIFMSKSFMATNKGEHGNILRANTFYVALTRFRNEVTIVYPVDCAVRKEIQDISVNN